MSDEIIVKGMRKVTAFSSGQNSRKFVVESKAETWGELMKDFDAAGVVYKNMSVVERATRNNLVVPDAILPKGDFLVYLLPEKTDSGVDATAWPYKDLRGFIQSAIAQNGDSAKAHFNVDKNYTLKSTPEMIALVNSYTGTVVFTPGVPVAAKPEKVKKEKTVKTEKPADNGVGKVVDSVAKAKSTTVDIRNQAAQATIQSEKQPLVSDLEKVNQAETLLNSINKSDGDILDGISDAVEAIQSIRQVLNKNAPQQLTPGPAPKTEEQLQREEEERMDRELQEEAAAISSSLKSRQQGRSRY